MTDGISAMVDILKTAVAVIPFLLLCLLSIKVNLKKPIRDRQFLMPIIALVFVLFLMFGMRMINNWVLSLMHAIPGWINSFLDWIPDQVSNAISTPINSVLDYLRSLDLNYWIMYISNTLIIVVYLIVKRIIITIMKVRFKKRSSIHDAVCAKFYEHDAENDVWCLKDNMSQTRTVLKVVFYTTVVVASVLMIVSGRMYLNGLLADIYYPVVSVLLIGEVFFFMDGFTKQEYSQNVLGDDENSYRIVNYSLLRKYLRSLFSDKLLSENTNVNNALEYDVTNEEVLERLLDDADQKVVNFALFYSKLNASGVELDHNYLNSSLDLLKGKSILFNNPFYEDLIPYAFYPLNRTLLSRQKVLVILGRHAIEDDVRQWIMDGIEAVTNIPFMWKIDLLDDEEKDIDIGIITRSKVIDAKMHEINENFLKKVGFVIILEPSKLVSTAQIGLNLLVKRIRGYDDKPVVYCMCDKNCDGLVDAMSHILMTSFTEVSATGKHLGTSSYMCWEADSEYLHHRMFPNVSRYLGMGTELSFAALKNQVAKTVWYGGDAFPVTDIRWIDRQYYYELMKFAALPTGQDAMNRYFVTTPNMWSAKVSKNNYFTVEDESCNMFEILRDFSTRSTEQGFINIVSTDYLLKDYMASNDTIFETDAKAIPNMVADYARTNRNVILRLMLLLSITLVNEESIRKEFSLMGLPLLNTRRQLWFEIYKCISDIETISGLPENYREAVSEVSGRSIPSPNDSTIFKIDIIKSEEKYNYEIGKMEVVYHIANSRFIDRFVNELKSSSYVAEDEKGEQYFLGSEIRGHIYQKYLPGQFFTFDGKYYEMQYLTAENHVLVRRAADHINGRPVYRQFREYAFSAIRPSDRIGSVKEIDGIKIIKEYADISVSTPGYLRMERYNDFKTAKPVMFEGEKTGIPVRKYHNKAFLRIDFPDSDGFTPNVRYTITVLMNEVFKTLFAENQPFISAVTDDSFIPQDAECKPFTYSIHGDGIELSSNSIYIIEDSQLDLGLIITVERNLKRIFQIIQDYIAWNKREIKLSLNPPAVNTPMQIAPEDIGEYKPKKKDNIFKRIIAKIASFFKRKKNRSETDNIRTPEPVVPTVPEPEPVVPTAPEPEKTPEDPDMNGAKEKTENDAAESTPDQKDIVSDPGEDTPDVASAEIEPAPPANMPGGPEETVNVSSNDEKKSAFDFTRAPYHKRYYLLYGYDTEPTMMDLNATNIYLTKFGYNDNPLRFARNGRRIAKYVEATFKPNKKDARYCDFCGSEIYGVEYETISDGRDRCISCSRTAVKTEEEFRKIFEDVKRNLESFFGIKLNVGVKVQMVDSQKLHRRLKKAFVPTPSQDGRVLGVAIKDKNGYSLLVENGSPRIMSMLTIAHELTHIWQYTNWQDKYIKRRYGKALWLQVYEGMAKWVEIQYAYLINEPSLAKREEIITVNRDDEYGHGYIRYKANYPISESAVLNDNTPFMNKEMPLDPMYCGDVSVMLDPNNGARGYQDDLLDEDEDYIDVEEEQDIVEKRVFEPCHLRDVNNTPLYAYQQLTKEEQVFYDLFLSAVKNHSLSPESIPPFVTEQVLIKIRDYVLIDHPEIFWFSGKINYLFEKESGRITSCEFVYSMTPEEAAEKERLIEESLTSFLSGITDKMSDYEVAVAVYNNIIDLVDYDSLRLEQEKSKNKINDDVPDDLRSIFGVFVNKKAVCAGYAKATQYLFNRLGIECVYVSGIGDDGPHAWNLVNLEGEYYYIDTTWDDHSNTKDGNDSSREITYDYFCITTELLLRDHKPDDTIVLPECNSLKCNYYYRNGLLLDHYNFTEIRSIIKAAVADGNTTVPLKAMTSDVYQQMYDSLIDGKKTEDVIRYLNLDSATRVSTSYSYSYSEEKLRISITLSRL